MLITKHLIQIIFTIVFAVESLFNLAPYTPPVEKRDMTLTSLSVSEGLTLSPDYVIVRGAACAESEINATEILQKYLKQISGVTYEIVTDETEPTTHEIIVGKTNREGTDYTVNRSELGDEGVYLKTVGEKLIISGAETRGTVYAVYEFLKMYLDCRWYTAELTVIPEASQIVIPEDIDYTFVPPLYYRSTYFTSCSSKEFCIANHLSGDYIGDYSAGGSLFTFLPPAEYFNEHPEYYSLINGERSPSQLCMTNPDALQAMIDSVQKCLDEKPNLGRIQVSPEAYENYPPCECESCKALNEAEATVKGSASGSYYKFINDLADHFAEKYPNLIFTTLAYANTATPTKTLKIHNNVSVMFAVTAACYAHKLTDTGCKNNVETIKTITEWKAVAKNIEIFDYIADYGHYVGIYPIFHILQSDIQDYIANNVIGVFGLGNGYADAVGGFDNLTAYLLSNLYWNPDADYNQLMVEFCKAYFGDAAQNIIQYLDIACYRAENSKNLLRQHITMSEDMHDGGIATLTSPDRAYINRLWEDAKKCNLTDAQRKNVLHAEICWRYWKASNAVDEFSPKNIDTKLIAAQKLLEDMKSFGINRVCEGEQGRNFSDSPNLMRAPFYWQARWDEDLKILRLF